jgi:DNA-binding transcriptional ArsR family regulator
MRETMAVIKALADESRARIVLFLGGGELCVCQIVEMLGLAPSTVSKHLDVLYQAGLVDARKDGRWVYYRLSERSEPGKKPSGGADGAVAWLAEALTDAPTVREDRKRLKLVLKTDKETLCCRYRG